MSPSKIRPGTLLEISSDGGHSYKATFVRREPARGKGCPAKNVLHSPDWVGLSGPDDKGYATISDYDLARRGRIAGAAA